MQKVNDAFEAAAVTDDGVRKLLQLRFEQHCGANFVIVEPCDTIEALEAATGCPILTSWLDDAIYPSDDFAPGFEYVENHKSCYEMVFVLNDDDATVVLIIPKERIDATLLALCRQFS